MGVPSLNDLAVDGTLNTTNHTYKWERQHVLDFKDFHLMFKESGPFVETPRIFLYMQNINYAEILARKNEYYSKIISDRGITFVPT